jgi:hypothetical protein
MLAKLRVAAAASGPVTAADDQFNATEDTPLVVAAAGVLANDTGATSAQVVAMPRSGSVVLNADGSFTYMPAADFSGGDAFSYTASNGTDVSLPATVRISVAATADAPVALAQSVGLDARTSANVTLTGRDPDGDPLAFYITDLPDHGTLSIVNPLTSVEQILGATDLRTASNPGTAIPSALVIYTPDAGGSPTPPPYSGTDSFQFVVADAASASAAAAVTATVHPLETTALTGTPLMLSVVDNTGAAVAAYRWTLEEDRTHEVVPGTADPNTLAVSFHASYMPVLQTGDEATQPLVDPAKRYFVSVLPKAFGLSNGGAQVARNQGQVTIVVNKGKVPTARVRVRVFLDNAPLNGMWDTGEAGLSGFEVTLDDAGGRYGMSGGQMFYDAFGNALGTIYGECSTGPGTCESYEVVRNGSGFVLTDAEGWALIENLPPGKYGVKVRAPGGAEWQQTATIEGTPVIDAWVKANEPQYFAEFGPPGPHADVGFIQRTADASFLGAGAGPISTI